ncbi:acetyl-CoA C-acyltransferase [Aneurinibacillus sp. UBA3580]|jgi:acetyl-CoA C-acetyltransferase|uniref:acetyl-CoA C-acyltransferase n=1 Tax=Aneurinibacillus sp. UBA3580 TaxID=1946041 RepID=UPI00257B1A2B|nr:acetyl-CoA C-acyltransferase [Aneurinibacillus sp. UBA3580]
MHKAVIVAAKRSAIGKVDGMYRERTAEELAAPLLRYLARGQQIDEVILGNAVGKGNVARLALLQAGLPLHVPGITVNRQCSSGLDAVILAMRTIQAGGGRALLAGGTESTSASDRTCARFSPESIGNPGMIEAAENVAKLYRLSRRVQDAFAVWSHEKACRANVHHEILGEERDECPRSNMKRLAGRARPICGTITAANSCPENDGAAAVLVTTDEYAKQRRFTEGLHLIHAETSACDPNVLGLGAVDAIKRTLSRNGLGPSDISAFAFNEAFASQTLATIRETGIPLSIVNRTGGALAYGHPYGASGAILLVKLFYELREGEYGLAAIAAAGGLGSALLVKKERIE